MKEKEDSYLRKQAWDYFNIHSSQRMTTFNFYLIMSSVISTSYFASSKSDSNLQSARPALAFLLCVVAFVFWKLEQRNKFLVKHAERALKYFEQADPSDDIAKVLTNEERDTSSKKIKGWRKVLLWRLPLSYSDCFNLVFFLFFLIGLIGVVFGIYSSISSGFNRMDIHYGPDIGFPC